MPIGLALILKEYSVKIVDLFIVGFCAEYIIIRFIGNTGNIMNG